MPNPATSSDIANRWRPLSAQETVNAETFLSDAWVMLKRQLADAGVNVETQMTSDQDTVAEVVRVLSTAVLRVLKNPEGKRAESIDDYRWERDQAVSSGLLYFTDDELSALLPGNSGRRRAFSLDPLADYESRWA